MLAEFLQTRTVQPGEQIFCYIPESGRFMAAYMLLQAEGPDETAQPARARAVPAAAPAGEADFIAPPHDPAHAPQGLEPLLGELAAIITKGSIFFPRMDAFGAVACQGSAPHRMDEGRRGRLDAWTAASCR
ncbi:hypothetical protein ASC26_16320 [Bordetella pertussis]|nr:hypothetical protein ASC26_16320 [Bordetella pertussis]